MITVSLIKELHFIAEAFGSPVSIQISLDNSFIKSLYINVSSSTLEVFHEKELIWKESLSQVSGNFGIESCQHIFEILNLKARREDYKDLIYIENS